MAIVDTGSLVSFSFDMDTLVMSVYVKVVRDDGLGDNLSIKPAANREIQLSLNELQAESATHAGSTLNGQQWLIGARKAVLDAIKTKLAPNTDAVSVGIKAIPTA